MSSREKRRLASVGCALLACPVLLVACAGWYFRHVPYEIPAEHALGAPEPRPDDDGGLYIRYLGTSGYEVSDGFTTILLDPTPTRPTVLDLVSGPLEPDSVLHARHARADFILVSHAHFDHVLDVPGIALATGALVIGSPSVVGYARSREVPAERTRVVESGERLELGSFVVDVRAVHHTAIAGVEEPLSGTIPSDAGGLWFWEFGCDVALAFRLEAAGASLWFHPSSSIYRTGTARGRAAGTLVIGVSGEPLTRRSIEAAFAEVRPERVLPTHYDNFLQPMARGHALMPGLDLDAAREAVLAVDPTVAWYVLDYEQEIRLPRDRAN